jgi:hypothetical protein
VVSRRIPGRSWFVARGCAVAAQVLLITTTAWSAGPEAHSLLPAGGERGTTVDVSVGGKLPNWPVQTWTEGAGLTISPKEEKGKLSITIAADAVPGTRWIRVYDAAGSSSPLPFVIGTLAETLETEPNKGPGFPPTPLTTPIVANGRLGGRGDVDVWPVALGRGQTLVASLAAHETLGSPVDAVMQIVSSSGQTLAYNHDERGLDPEIRFVVPADGTYLVRLFGFPSAPNQTIGFAGGDSYVYRLTLTTGPFGDYCWPLAVTRGGESRVDLVGWNLADGVRSCEVATELDEFLITEPGLANTTSVRVEPHATIVETEPNAAASAQAITLPVTISGRIEAPGDVDAFAFAGKKGEPLLFELASRELGYPLDAVLQVLDAAGQSLARADDVGEGRDPLLTFTPPADGLFRLLVQDLTAAGSSRHVYRLRATRPEPTFNLMASGNAFALSGDKPLEIAISIDRQHGFAEEITFRVEGLPEFVSAAPVVSPGTGDAAKSIKLTLTSKGGSFSGPIRIIGQSSGALALSRVAAATLPSQTVRCDKLWLTAVAATQRQATDP